METTTTIRQKWDQQPDETVKDYRRFLAFLGIGPTRTIEAFWRKSSTDANRRQSRPPGRLHKLAREHDWHDRAIAHDLHNLLSQNERFAAIMVDTMTNAARLLGEAFLEDFRPTTWAEGLDGLDRLAKYLPVEQLLRMMDHARENSSAG